MNLRCSTLFGLVIALASSLTPATAQSSAMALVGGRWFNGERFVAETKFVAAGRFVAERPTGAVTEIDLRGRWVVPPYGEAHNHWLESDPDAVEAYVQHYLTRGVFYVKDQATAPIVRKPIAARLNRPDTVDYIAANQGFTGPGAHPLQIVRQMQAVGCLPTDWGMDRIDGEVVMIVRTLDDLEARWQRLLAGKPDFVKVFLLYSEVHAERSGRAAYRFRCGLDPQLVPHLVKRARSHGLQVSAHVYSAADFRGAVAAGVNQIAHMPGMGFDAELGIDHFVLTAADAAAAAKAGVSVITTIGAAVEEDTESERNDYVAKVLKPNVEVLRSAGVKLLIGSDMMRRTTDVEAMWLHRLGLFTNLQLLRAWCIDTPRDAFPDRDIARFTPGAEASFLVLEGDPLADWSNTGQIALRVKQGRMLLPREVAFPRLQPR